MRCDSRSILTALPNRRSITARTCASSRLSHTTTSSLWYVKPGSDDRTLPGERPDRILDGEQGLPAPTDRDNLHAIRLLDQAIHNGGVVGCANGHREHEHDRIAVVVEPNAAELVDRQRLAVTLDEGHIGTDLQLLAPQTTAPAVGIVASQVDRHVPSVARELGPS